MEKFWLYLIHDTFIWSNDNSYLLYNCDLKQFSEGQNSKVLASILRQLQEITNLNCVAIVPNVLRDKEVRFFIKNLINKSIGGLKHITDNPLDRPISFPPVLNIQSEIKRKQIESMNYLDPKIRFDYLSYINSVSFDVDTSKQLSQLKSSLVELEPMQPKLIFSIDVNVGEIKSVLNEIIEISRYMKNIFLSFNVDMYLKFASYLENFFRIGDIIIEDNIHTIANYMKGSKSKAMKYFPCHFNTIIETKKDLMLYQQLRKTFEGKISVLPLLKYNGKNRDFILGNIIFNQDELKEKSYSKVEIFRHMSLNTNYFGKLYVNAKGDISSHQYYSSTLSNIEKLNAFRIAIKEELNSKRSNWLLTRNQGRCEACNYKYLCPPISDIERSLTLECVCSLLDK